MAARDVFCSPWPLLRSASDAFRPPKRISVAEGAAQSLMIQQPGGYNGPWSPTETPYMIEPMNMLSSRRHEAVVFVGPARTGKTLGLLDGWFSRNVTCDPGDMLIVQMSQEKAREFSKTRIDRAIRHSPALREKMSARGHDDNTHDKLFKHGMWVKIGWPSATQLSSSDYRYVALTDYDRMPDDIDGEGAPYGLALKRTQTFLSRGMCMVESSPGRDVVDPHWEKATHHEAPPCSGIVGIYNRSDRRRWYWSCPDCSEYFEAAPGLALLSLLPPESELVDIVRTENLPAMAEHYAKVICPHCGSVIEQRTKPTLNDIRTARWLADGQSIIDGEVVGDALHSSIAGYWLGGVAAAYQKWDSLLLRYLQGLREFVLTGSELTLKTTVNTDQGMPYMPQHYRESKTSRAPSDRLEQFDRFMVPEKTRFIVAAVDVQGGQGARFVVQVHAVGEHLEQWLIDRFEITESAREGVDGGKAPIDPASYPEDWDMLTSRVVLSTYRIGDGREMRVRVTAVDTGGEDGVTENAYAWYRRIRAAGQSHRAMLVKGASAKPRSVVVQTMVGAKREGQEPDIPLFLLGTDQLKDAVHGMLHREQHGPGFIHLPTWLNRAFFDEIKAEVRDASGKWRKIRKRNEAFDLMCYIRAACIKLGADRFRWGALPPSMSWAAPIDTNVDVISTDARREMKESATAAPIRRRATRSNYLR